MKEYIERFLERHFQTDWKSCTDEQLYQALLSMTQEKTQQLPKRDEKGRKLYYLSAEFLVGRLLGNNLLNLGLYEQVDNLLQSQGRSLAAIEELEAEPSLGNGGLGSLLFGLDCNLGTVWRGRRTGVPLWAVSSAV